MANGLSINRSANAFSIYIFLLYHFLLLFEYNQLPSAWTGRAPFALESA
jgi:hypothetical protein